MYSLILPIYNVENYIEECLQAIVNQKNAPKYEVLLIDDGSTDTSGLIASEYADKHPFIHFFQKTNGGLSDARNFGLEKSIGDYIVFVDSDDVISCDLLSVLNEVIERDGADFVYYNFIKFVDSENIDVLFCRNHHYNKRKVHKRDVACKPNFAWARVTKRDYYIENTFPVGLIYEDVLTTPLLTFRCKNPYIVDTPLYGYRKRPGSITTTSASNQFRFFETLERLRTKSLESNTPLTYYNTAFVNLSQSALVSLARITEKNVYRDKKNQMEKEFSKISLSVAMQCMSSPKAKLLYLIIRLGKLNTPLLYLIKFLTNINDRRNNFSK